MSYETTFGTDCVGMSHIQFTPAARIAQHLIQRFNIDPEDTSLAVRLYPKNILTNQEAVTMWVVRKICWRNRPEPTAVLKDLTEAFYKDVVFEHATEQGWDVSASFSFNQEHS